MGLRNLTTVGLTFILLEYYILIFQKLLVQPKSASSYMPY